MKQQTQIQLSRRILAHLEAKTTDLSNSIMFNDVTAFTCPYRLEKEWNQLFANYPQYLGLSNQIPNSGDYLTNNDLNKPLLITRDQTGRARAFLNVCRHRGARLTNGFGNSRQGFSCPYHAWRYDIAGQLIAIPDAKSFPGIEKDQYGLMELPLAEKYGMIFVLPDQDGSIDLESIFGGLNEELASYNFANYHHYKTHSFRWKLNWKIAVDTFLEPYHFPALHKDTVGPIFFPNLCVVDTFGRNLREVLPRRGIIAMRNQPEHYWNLIEHSAIIYVIFPNVVIVVQIDHYEIWRIYPADKRVDESIIYLEFYIPKPAETIQANEHWRKNLELTLRTVELEDFPAGESIQSGLLSGGQKNIVYGRNELALQFFESTVAETIGSKSTIVV